MMSKEHEAVRNTRRKCSQEDARSNQFNVTAAQIKQSVQDTVQLRMIYCTLGSLNLLICISYCFT